MISSRVLCAMALMLAELSAGLPSERWAPAAGWAGGAAPPGVRISTAVGSPDRAERIQVSIGLPLRDPEGLAGFRRQLHDPASPGYRQWLTDEAFAERFGPSAEDYAKVAAWARAKGLDVTGTFPNRLLLCVSGTAADLENAFGVRMLQYRHPSGVLFRSADRIPTLDLDVAIDTVNGLNDLPRRVKRSVPSRAVPMGGSGPGGSFLGGDLRKAYAAGVPSTVMGAGQGIALLEFSEYYPADYQKYFSDAGMTAPTVVDVKVSGGATDDSGQDEVALDIEVAGSLAPSATLYVYEGEDGTAIFERISTDGFCRAVGVSWGWLTGSMTDSTSIDPTQDAVLQAMDTKGIACFVASGDSGVWTDTQWHDTSGNNPINPADSPYVTCVGATHLTTSASGAWLSEVPWDDSNGTSSGGPSLRYILPSFQASGIPWASISGASTTYRNCPDVVANGVNYYVEQGKTPAVEYLDGTSAAAPLWAAFTALLNETASAQGVSSLGNLNTILYEVATSAEYGAAYHDITSGNDGFAAGTGFDMASGWGSMVGQATLGALIGEVKPVAPSIVTQPQGATTTVGNPATFSVLATGTPTLTYQWSKNGTAIGGATSASYTTPAEVLSDSGASFTVKVTNGQGSVTSSAATLTVNPAPVAPSITAQPQSATVLTGQSVTFSVTATGTAPLSYQWSKNNSAISGATASTLTITAGTVPNAIGDAYQVVVSNALGSATSATAMLYVTSKSLDLNGDGTLDVLDLAALAAAYGTGDAAAELDGGATVDDQDITIWLAGFGGNP